MKRLLFFPVTVAVMTALSIAGCLTDSGGDDDGNTDTSKYSVTLQPSGTTQLLVKEETPLKVTTNPDVGDDEFFFVTVTGGDSTYRDAYMPGTTFSPYSFSKEGEYTITVEVLNKIEFELLELLAPDYGHAELSVSVREPEIHIEHEVYGDYAILKAESYVADWFPSGTKYTWDFNDGSELVTVDTTVVNHTFEKTGDYDISVTALSPMNVEDTLLSIVAGDTTSVSINTLLDKKKLTISSLPKDGRFLSGSEVDLKVAIEPPPEPGEMLFWEFSSADTAFSWLSSAVRGWEATGERFSAGDYSLKVALLDSLEIMALGTLAPHHGSDTYEFSVRDITVEIKAAQTGDGEYTFTAYSPEQDWLPYSVEYKWDFGDGDTSSAIDETTIDHEYTLEGEYDVIVSVNAYMTDEMKFRDEVASDTLTVVVDEYVPELTVTISPQDTTFHAVREKSVKVFCDPPDYNRKVTWKVDYGDGETKAFSGFITDKILYHNWVSPGQHILDVALHDPETDALLAQDSAVITVDNTTFLIPMNYVYVHLKAYTVYHYGKYDEQGTYSETSEWDNNWGFGSSDSDTVWNGTSFSTNNTYKNSSGNQTTIITITGSVAEDLSEVEHVVFTHEFEDVDYQNTGRVWTRFQTFTLDHVPIQHTNAFSYNSIRTTIKGGDVGQYVTGFEAWERMTNADGSPSSYNYYGPFDYTNSEDGEAELNIEIKEQ